MSTDRLHPFTGVILKTIESCVEESIADILEHRRLEIIKLTDEVTRLHKKLCVYEGHLIITDSDGRHWCELCQEEIMLPKSCTVHDFVE